MKYNKFQNTDLKVSAIGLGTWVFGGEFWGGAKEEGCVDVVGVAIDQGVNFIDTAPFYGFGKAENIVGKAIKNKRDKVILATKCGLIRKGKEIIHNLKADSIRTEIEGSLKRLQVEYIDLYQCHWPDPNTSIIETMDVLNQLKEEGKIRYVGVSNFGLDLLEKVTGLADVISLQNQYSLLERGLENGTISYCRDEKIGVIAYGALGGGILSGKYVEPPVWKGADARNFFYKYYKEEKFRKVQEILLELEKILRPLNQIALNWVRQQEQVIVTLVGCRNVKQVLENAEAMSWDLSEDELRRIGGL